MFAGMIPSPFGEAFVRETSISIHPFLDRQGKISYTRQKGGGAVELAHKKLDGESGHEAGRELLARLLGGKLPEIAVTEAGKPYFPEKELHFSITHTKSHAFCALSRRSIGIDAEEIGREITLPPERLLSPGELARFDGTREMLLRFWVLKEAFAKLTGRGWGNYLRETDFDPNDPRIQITNGCYLAILEEEDHAF